MYGSNSYAYSAEDIAPTKEDSYDLDDYEHRARNIETKRRSLVAAAAAALVGHFGSGISQPHMAFNAWSFYNSFSHVDYQYGQWPVIASSLAMKKGYYQAAQQTRWKTLQKRYEKKTKRAKGKTPIYVN